MADRSNYFIKNSYDMEAYYQQFSNWLTLRNYAARTKKSFRYEEQKVSWQTVNGDYSSLRLFYTNILDREWDLRKLPRPRKQKSLPKVITPEQVSLLIENGVMFKHKVFFTLIYSTGLRLGEALRLRVEDVDVAAMQLRVLDGKGKKDRFTLLSPDTLDLLRFYIRAYRPKGGLIFNGKYKGKPWSEKGAQHAMVLARRKAKLPEFVTAHTLRHCFATHLLESGTDLVTIQQLMGHKHLKTTVRYIHLDNQHFQRVNNPADRIEAWKKITKSVTSSENMAKPSSPNIAPIATPPVTVLFVKKVSHTFFAAHHFVHRLPCHQRHWKMSNSNLRRCTSDL